MYEISGKRKLCPDVALLRVKAPLIAQKARPGQFVMVRLNEQGERIPLTIAASDKAEGTITLIFKEIGKTTAEMGRLGEGDSLLNVAGPLGKPSEIRKYGTVVCIGGGIGSAPVYPIAKALKEAGNELIIIMGARTKDYVILEREMRALGGELHITTDDGSGGRKGFVSDVLKEMLEGGRRVDLAVAIGPVMMMKIVSEVTRPYGIRTLVSLNPIMVDGTGMCGGCRVTVGGETKFACVDGPEFDGHKVDFDNLILRNRRFERHECRALKGLSDSNAGQEKDSGS
jgi:ferredoxin/flavodoxin---NADP+ reductase